MHPTDWFYALRSLRRNPRFTLAALLTLALGIGANAAIFCFLDTVYLRPLPYALPDRLVTLWETPPAGKSKQSRLPLSPAAWSAWRANPIFAASGAWGWDIVTLTGGPWPERVQVQRIAGDYFRALDVQPVLGRAFRPEEETGKDCTMLLSARLWRTWLAADPNVIGKPFLAEGAPCTVIGVMPDSFLPPLAVSAHVDAWMPLAVDPAQSANRTRHSLWGLACLAPGVTPEQAGRRLNDQARQTSESIPDARGWGARVIPLKDAIIGTPKLALFALAGAVGFLLLIACVNVATLFTARAAGQRRQIAIRAALGAGRYRLVSHLLAQALLLAMIGGAAGFLTAAASLRALVVLAHSTLPRLNEAAIDWRVLAFTVFLSVGTGLLFGLAPAVSVTRASLRETLARPRTHRLWRSAQAVAEIALAFVLLVGAGLLIRSFQAIRAVDLGFRTENILAATFALPPSHYADREAYLRFLDAALDRVRATPGVHAATVTLGVPMRGSAEGDFEIYGSPTPAGDPREAAFRPGDSEYFSTFGMTIVHGRAFTPRDVEGAPRVALVNEKLARQYFGGEDPIGRQIRAASKSAALPWMTIVGVVHDTRHIGPLRDSLLEIYFPYAQFRSTAIQPRALVVRTISRPEGLLPSLQRAVASADPDQPLVSVSTMEENLTDFIAPQRFDTALMAVFAAIGLALAAVGIFGVMSYRVAQRTHEIGIRMALGARRADVRRTVLAEALVSAAAGLALGWMGSWALTRYLAALLFTIRPGDPVTLAGVSALIFLTASAAAWLPARRASRIDPMAALRTE